MSGHIVVFGAEGFIGSHLASALEATGRTVFFLVRRHTDRASVGGNVYVGEYQRAEAFAPYLAGAHAVIHCASQSTPGSTANAPLVELEENLRPTLALLEAMQNGSGGHLLYLSSGGALYDDAGTGPLQEGGGIRPRSYHGAGKVAAEFFIQSAVRQFGISATVIRPANIYGGGQKARVGFGIIPTAFESIASGMPLTIWGDGETVRDYLYVKDFVRLCLAVLDKPRAGGFEVLNAGSGRGTSLNRLLQTIRDVTGAPLPVVYSRRRGVDASRIVLDIACARERYSWSPEVLLEEGVALAWGFWLADR